MNSEATYQAFDGIELRFGERVVRSAPLTVAEAVRYLRLLSRVEADFGAHDVFVAEFTTRIGIGDVPVCDLGIEGYDLTVHGAIELVDLLQAAQLAGPESSPDELLAASTFLARFPAKAETPGEVFAEGVAFAQRFYHVIYGLASDFLTHLTTSPSRQVKMMWRATPMTMRSPPASTT